MCFNFLSSVYRDNEKCVKRLGIVVVLSLCHLAISFITWTKADAAGDDDNDDRGTHLYRTKTSCSVNLRRGS